MHKVFLNLGSNVDPAPRLRAGLDELLEVFGRLRVSRAYHSAAVGFAGEPFLNLGVELQTERPVAELMEILRGIEAGQGRRRDVPRFSDRSLDIDLLLYGDLHGEYAGVRLPRGDIRRYAFVLLPLLDLAPDQVDPADGSRYAAMLADYRLEGDASVVPFTWRDQELSAQPAAEITL